MLNGLLHARFRRFCRRFIVRLGLLLGIVVLLASVTAHRWIPGIGHWLAQEPHPHPADAIVVLGSSNERALHGIALYHQGLAPEFWHTGDALSTWDTGFNAQAAAQLARDHGVPAERIHLLDTTSTWEDGRAIVALANERNLKRILVVTSWYHSRRALCVIRHQLADSGVRVYYDPPRNPHYGPDDWWSYGPRRRTVVSELGKIGWYGLRYGIIPAQCA